MAAGSGDATADAAPPSTPPAKKSRAAPSVSKPTPEKAAAVQGEAARRQAYEELFGGLPIEQLKGCLRANQQLLSGNKADLVERCVDLTLTLTLTPTLTPTRTLTLTLTLTLTRSSAASIASSTATCRAAPSAASAV